MLNTKKRIIVSISLLATIFIALIGITYAYYATRVTGNTSETPSLSLKSGYLSIVYEGKDASISGGSTGSETKDLEYTKSFTIKNDGVLDAYYGVWIENYSVKDTSGNKTTFSRPEDWTYVLTMGDEIIKSGTFPTDDEAIITAKPLAQGATHDLTLTVTYNYITEEEGGTDQSADIGKTLTFDIAISQGLDILESAKEGTLLAAIKRDNEVTEPVTEPGKSPSGITNYIEEEWSSETKSVNVSYSNKYYWTYGTGYEFDELSGTYTLTGVSECKYDECYNNILSGENIYLPNIIPAEYNPGVFKKTSGLNSIYKIDTASLSSITYYTKSSISESISEATLSTSEDDYGISYYYRGSVENNYVNYSGMCWRIVRVQGDGTIKLALADENNKCNSSSYSLTNETSAFIDSNTAIDIDFYHGGTFEGSSVESTLNTWINNKIIKENDKDLLENTEWCNDTSVTKELYFDSAQNLTVQESEDNLGSYYEYGAYSRLADRSKANPTFKCNHLGLYETNAIRVTANIGILTADELAFAGDSESNPNLTYNYYLQTNATGGYYLTMSLYDYYYFDGYFIYTTKGSGFGTHPVNLDYQAAIRPSVVLKRDVEVTTESDTTTYGEPGTYTNPYNVVIS